MLAFVKSSVDQLKKAVTKEDSTAAATANAPVPSAPSAVSSSPKINVEEREEISEDNREATDEKHSLMDKTADSMRQLKSKVGDWFGIAMPGAGSDAEPPREQTMLEELDEMTSLTWQQRMTGFAMALGMGILFIVLAMTFVPVLALFPQKFAFFYSVGSLFCVCSTAFLVGLRKQLTMMFEAHRAEAAAAYFGCLVLTLFSAVHLKSAILSFFFAGCQIVAVVWYSMSYIPFARQFFMTFGGYIWAAVKPVLSAAGSCIMGCCRMIW